VSRHPPTPTPTPTRRAVVGGAVALVAGGTGCTAVRNRQGSLTVRVRPAPAAFAPFDRFEIRVVGLAVDPATPGMGWSTHRFDPRTVDLAPPTGPLPVATVAVTPGPYERARLVLDGVAAVRADGGRTRVLPPSPGSLVVPEPFRVERAERTRYEPTLTVRRGDGDEYDLRVAPGRTAVAFGVGEGSGQR
jgi:hypothetical protein